MGFNKMIGEAAMVPRRFGFAPHTREMYDSKEQFEAERSALFKQLCGAESKVTLENWIAWAKPHIFAKAANLEDHRYARWERSYMTSSLSSRALPSRARRITTRHLNQRS